jgi:ribosome modulation factor
MDAFLKFRSDRAFYEGMQAYRAGHPKHAPTNYCEHASDWVRGWNVAWLAATVTPVKPAPSSLNQSQRTHT